MSAGTREGNFKDLWARGCTKDTSSLPNQVFFQDKNWYQSLMCSYLLSFSVQSRLICDHSIPSHPWNKGNSLLESLCSAHVSVPVSLLHRFSPCCLITSLPPPPSIRLINRLKEPHSWRVQHSNGNNKKDCFSFCTLHWACVSFSPANRLILCGRRSSVCHDSMWSGGKAVAPVMLKCNHNVCLI